MLRPGGMMLYSTCTFDPSENEQTIEYLLEEYPEFEICEMAGYEGFAPGMPEVTDSKNPNLAKTVRIFPHRMEGEGHYLALLKKGEGSPIALKEKDSKKGGNCRKSWKSFSGTFLETGSIKTGYPWRESLLYAEGTSKAERCPLFKNRIAARRT